LKKWLLGGALLLFLAAAGGGYWFFVTPTRAAGQTQEAKTATGAPPGATFQVGEIMTNLADTGSRHYIKISVDLWLDTAKAAETVKERKAAVRHAVIGVLRSKTSQQLVGRSGMEALRSQILDRLDGLLPDGTVTGLYFNSFLIQ